MNRWLVSMLATINALLAAIIVVLGAILGFTTLGPVGLVVGLIGGFVVAAIVCGMLAALCLIERHLRVMADDLRAERKRASAQ